MAGPLHGVSVLDASVGPAAAVVTMVLADYGADVVRVDPPGGVPSHGQPAYQAWDRGKRSVVLDLAAAHDRDTFTRLVDSADVYIDDHPGVRRTLGLGLDDLGRRCPELVHVSISADGRPDVEGPLDDTLTGARLGRYGGPAGVSHTGWLSPTYATASLALLGGLAALLSQRRGGGGQRVEVSMRDGLLALWSFDKLWQERHADVPPPDPASQFRGKRLLLEMYECADGRYLQFHTGAPGRFWRTMQLLGLDGRISPSQGLLEMAETLTEDEVFVVEHDIPKVMRSRSRDEWLQQFWAADICCQPVLSPEEAFDDPQIRHNGVIVELDDPDLGPLRQIGPTVRMSATPAAVRGPRPHLGQHSAEVTAAVASRRARLAAPASSTHAEAFRSALEGIRVLDFGQYIAGPLASRFLADLGAEVIKVEPLAGDTMRPLVPNWEYGNRGKRAMSVDLKSPAAQEIVRRLLPDSDVVGHNLRPGVAERLGIGYDTLRDLNPALVYLASPGFGSSGPKVDHQSFAPITGGTNGLYFDAGGVGNPPRRAGNEDYFNGALGAAAVIMALIHRQRTGQGQYLESPQVNAALFLMSHTTLGGDGRFRSRLRLDRTRMRYCALDGLYRMASGALAVTVTTDAEFVGLAQVLGRSDLAVDERFATAEDRRRHDDTLAAILVDALSGRDAATLSAALGAAGVPHAVVSATPFEEGILTSEEALSAGKVVEFDHPAYGRIREVGRLMGLSGTPCVFREPGALLGQHTAEILTGLGYRAEEVADLEYRHVVRTARPGVE